MNKYRKTFISVPASRRRRRRERLDLAQREDEAFGPIISEIVELIRELSADPTSYSVYRKAVKR